MGLTVGMSLAAMTTLVAGNNSVEIAGKYRVLLLQIVGTFHHFSSSVQLSCTALQSLLLRIEHTGRHRGTWERGRGRGTGDEHKQISWVGGS